jgi:hypothetical protein
MCAASFFFERKLGQPKKRTWVRCFRGYCRLRWRKMDANCCGPAGGALVNHAATGRIFNRVNELRCAQSLSDLAVQADKKLPCCRE